MHHKIESIRKFCATEIGSKIYTQECDELKDKNDKKEFTEKDKNFNTIDSPKICHPC